ncbi:MAG: type II toxin-antitoxin system PemK/MazF family toxin [Phycisphaerae bacterium]|nr:type II toxin-antitoxin system PemK/MazF family toxin [Phycisphaerae bacterium]
MIAIGINSEEIQDHPLGLHARSSSRGTRPPYDPTEVILSERDGMPRDCAVNCDHIQTVAKSRIGPTIAMLPTDRMEQIRLAIAFALDV